MTSPSINLIQQLVGWVDRFASEPEAGEFALVDFLIWMNAKVFNQEGIQEHEFDEHQINMELSFLLIMQNRHFNAYAKKALADSELSSPDSFSYLYHLSLVDSYRKMELVKMHQMEAPSGIEVLKRLLAKNYIEEYDDPDDKRAKRIKITELGKSELEERLPAMQAVFEKMTGTMNLSQKLHFITALRELNDFHIDNDRQLI